jgi:hypothetical protein
MKLTDEKKAKLKKVLLAISSDEEKDKLTQTELLANLVNVIESMDKKTEEKLGLVESNLETKYGELRELIDKSKTISVRHNSILLQSVTDFSENLNKKLEEIKELSKVVKGDVFGPEKAKDSNFAAFDNSGKKIKDSEFTVEGTHKITVSDSQPNDPVAGDIWIET